MWVLLSPVSTTRVDRFPLPVNKGRVDGHAFPLAELTGHVDGPTQLVETHARQHGPCWRVMKTGHPSTRAVNVGSGNRALLCYVVYQLTISNDQCTLELDGRHLIELQTHASHSIWSSTFFTHVRSVTHKRTRNTFCGTRVSVPLLQK